jgi:Flp pilus assembly protein TadD
MLGKMHALVFILALFTGPLTTQKAGPDQLLQTAIVEQQRGDYTSAIRDYRRVLELRPHSFEAMVNLGAALVHVGQFDAAIVMYRSALASSPQNNAVQMNLALAYYKKGDFTNAREQLEAAHHAQPKDVRTAVLLGDTYLHLKQADDSAALLTPLEPENAQNLDFEYVLGSALIQSGHRREGVARIEKVAQGGNSADAYMLAGATLLQMNDFQSARHDLDAALLINPKLPGLYSLAGTARDKTGDVQEAESAFRKALDLNPNDFDANLYLGAILYKRRELDTAKGYLEKAVQLDPTSSMARYEDAMLKSTTGEYEAAAQELEKLVHDDPTWLEPHVELASLYYRLHRPAEGAKERQVVDRLTAEQQAQGPGKQ